ncbi:MAG: hypothetical protein J6W65_07380 [Oscillospiraceae bacterium]|nr:hypothetical protein [Oscillospiraceae bacterium]
MAGYMTKLQGYVYEGELVNGAAAPVENGVLMVQGTSTDADKLKFAGSADTTTKLVCKEVTTIYDGVTAYRFIVDKLNDRYYFVENGFDINDSAAYDKRTYTTAVGAELRAHPLLVGEEFVTTKVTGTPAVGTAYGVKTDGTVG